MARNTRQRRRQRRRAQGSAAGGAEQAQPQEKSVTQRARARQQAVRAPAQTKSQTGARRVPGSGFRRFVSESWAELKKVEWPNQNQVIQGTVVVLVACAIAGVYLWLNDQLWKEVVQKLILGQ